MLLKDTLQFAQMSRARSSMGKYSGKWCRFVAWCKARSPPYKCLPAHPLHVAMFLKEIADAAPSYAPVKMASAAIFAAHDVAGIDDNPTKSAMCKNVRMAAKRRFGIRPTNKKVALKLEVLQSMMKILAKDQASSLASLSLACFVAVMWAGCFRYSDLQHLLVEDVCFAADHMRLLIVQRKNDQFRLGHLTFIARGTSACCPVRLMETLLNRMAAQRRDHVFQLWHKDSKGVWQGSGSYWSYSSAKWRCLNLLCKALGQTLEVVKAQFGLHSFRAGGATCAVDNGVDLDKLQAHVGWQSKESVLGYVEPSLEDKLLVTRRLGY